MAIRNGGRTRGCDLKSSSWNEKGRSGALRVITEKGHLNDICRGFGGLLSPCLGGRKCYGCTCVQAGGCL